MSLIKKMQSQLDSHIINRVREDAETWVVETEDGTRWLFTENGMKMGIDGRMKWGQLNLMEESHDSYI